MLDDLGNTCHGDPRRINSRVPERVRLLKGALSRGQLIFLGELKRVRMWGVIVPIVKPLDVARIGRQSANGPEAQEKRAHTQRRNAVAQHSWKASDQPAWLTEAF